MSTLTPDQEKRVRNSLEPDHNSKSAYTGRITQTETVIIYDENGVPIQKEFSFFITWDTIKQMLEMIKKRAHL